MDIDKEKLKELACKSLKVVQAIVSSAAAICPPLTVASSIFGVVEKFVDTDDNIEMLKEEFQEINDGFEKLSEQIEEVMKTIKKEKTDMQFSKVEDGLNQQYKAYVKMITAPPEKMKNKAEKFRKVFHETLRGQHLSTLYDSVMGESKLFSDPILKVYKECSNNDRETMENLSNHLFYLLNIGCITMIAVAVLDGTNDKDMDDLRKTWADNLKSAIERIEEALKDCN